MHFDREGREIYEGPYLKHDVDEALAHLIEVCEVHVEKRLAWWTDIRDALERYQQATRAYVERG